MSQRIWILQNTIPVIMPISELRWSSTESVATGPPPKIYAHAPGNYCFYCACRACKMFFAHKPIQCVNPRTLDIPRTPRYSYMGLVNSMRDAAAKREEERQDKQKAERDATARVKTPEKGKVSKSPKKKIQRQSIKRRRV